MGGWAEKRVTFVIKAFFVAGFLALSGGGAAGQSNMDLARISKIPAVSGHEEQIGKAVRALWKDFAPKTDNVGNVWVTFGSGAPHRLIATAMDQPGYVVSGITEDGYLRVQRLPQAAPNAVFDTLHFAQPVWVVTRGGKQVAGVFAGLSIHLEPGRQNAPKMNHLDEMYVDIGAKNTSEVLAAGVDLLDPVSSNQDRRAYRYSVGNGGRFGVSALLGLPREVDLKTLKGTLTVALITQSWTGGRGLDRLLTEIHPDEMVYVGRLSPKQEAGDAAAPVAPKPGSGVLLGISESVPGSQSLADELQKLAANHVKLTVLAASPPRITGYAKSSVLPERFAQIGVPTLWPATPAETVNEEDVLKLHNLLNHYIHGKDIFHEDFVTPRDAGSPATIQALTEAYGASSHERAVREAVKSLLPDWARNKTETDPAGNLILHLGDGKAGTKTPKLAFVAHMDEIGYEVKSVGEDGRLLVEVLGGGYTQYFLGHAVLVHKADGSKAPGVLELPEGWDKPGFEWPQSARAMEEPVHVYLGTMSKEETEKLGIKPGDFVTIPKEYRTLLGTRANARSFDDRVGCAALVEAVKAIGPDLPGRDVTFVWSTGEELGLKGAAAYAERAANEGNVPDFVFAIDTFVSSDSPLELKRFGDAEIGKGFVVRAVDNSNIVPLGFVDRVVKLARNNRIPVQYGVTGGGNDGSVFTRYGSVDIALGWPLRYSHSPGEVIDTKDLDALGKIVAVLARNW